MSLEAIVPCLDETKLPTILTLQEQKKNNDENEKEVGGWTPLLVLAGITCCLGSALPAGFNMGVINAPAEIMQQFCNESIKVQFDLQINNSTLIFIWAIIVSIFLIGGVTGSLMASWIADKYGRRVGLAIGNIFEILGGIIFFITPFFNSIILLILGRLLVGFSGGIATSLLPMYMIEVSSSRQRGAVGTLCQLGITLGVLLGQIAGMPSVLGTEKYWHIMLASPTLLCIIALVLLYFLPESPKYLYLMKNKRDEAIQELIRLRNVHVNLLQREIHSLQQEASGNITVETWSITRVLKDPTLRLPLILVSLLQFGQQLSGINSIFFYSQQIFDAAKLNETDTQYAILGTGIINCVMAMVSVYLISRFNRRTLFFWSSYGSIACLAVLGVSYANIEEGGIVAIRSCIASVLIYVFTYGLGLGPIPYFIASELFEVGPRPIAMAIGSISNWSGNLIVALTFSTIRNAIGASTFLIFITFTLFVALFARTYLPETRNIDTKIIIAQLSHGFKSRATLISNT